MKADSSSIEAQARLEAMMLIRAYELQLAKLGEGGNFPISCSSLGQEASAVGVISALTPEDRILTNHRSAAHLIARGAEPGRLLAEVMGRADGYCKGKAGPLHISVKELGVVLTSTIVGGELSLATGVALAKKMLDESGIVVCFFGDGAACEGIFHESLNLASVWDLPILYVCENNEWQAFVSRREAMRAERISDWAAAYRIEGHVVDGNDVDAVFDAATNAVARIRETSRPMLLETRTTRIGGHYSIDDQSYIDPAERAGWAERDAIARYRERLIATGALDAKGAEELQCRAEALIASAVSFAMASSYPTAADVITDVYA